MRQREEDGGGGWQEGMHALVAGRQESPAARLAWQAHHGAHISLKQWGVIPCSYVSVFCSWFRCSVTCFGASC